MTSRPDVRLDVRDDGLAWITIDRPHKHNALARPVLAELKDAVRAAGDDARTRVVVLRGAGDAYFAAGGDLVDLSSVRSERDVRAMAEAATAALDAVREAPVPVVAYVNGDALGGGAELAVACDLRMLASHARIGFVHARLAITSAWGGGTDLCQLVGSARAMRMMTSAAMIASEEALAWGLVDVVVDGGPEGEGVRRFLAPMLEQPAAVLRGITQQVRAWRRGDSYAQRRAIERESLVATWLGDEHWAAVERFLARD